VVAFVGVEGAWRAIARSLRGPMAERLERLFVLALVALAVIARLFETG
jgi:hypothetical protein